MNCKLTAVGVWCAMIAAGAVPASAGARTHLVWAGGTPSFQKSLRRAFTPKRTTSSPTG